MTTSNNQEWASDCFAISENGTVIYLCSVNAKPSKARFLRLIATLRQRIPHTYKVLVWTPTTKPKPDKFKWKRKGGGYQGLGQPKFDY